MDVTVRLICEVCNEVVRTTLCLRRCPQLTRGPAMSPTVGPVQHHRFVVCNRCSAEATISILRVGNQAIDSNDRAKACMEIQLVGRFQVVTMELFGSVGMRLPCSNFCCQGPPNSNPNRRYQGNLIKTSFVPEQGYTIKVS